MVQYRGNSFSSEGLPDQTNVDYLHLHVTENIGIGTCTCMYRVVTVCSWYTVLERDSIFIVRLFEFNLNSDVTGLLTKKRLL